jgi:hypothetical protein
MGQCFSSSPRREKSDFDIIKLHLTRKCGNECDDCQAIILFMLAEITEKKLLVRHEAELIDLIDEYIKDIVETRIMLLRQIYGLIKRIPQNESGKMFEELFSSMNEVRDMELFLNCLYHQLVGVNHQWIWTNQQHNNEQRQIALLTHLPIDVSNKCPHCLRNDHTDVEAEACFNVRILPTKQRVHFFRSARAFDTKMPDAGGYDFNKLKNVLVQ